MTLMVFSLKPGSIAHMPHRMSIILYRRILRTEHSLPSFSLTGEKFRGYRGMNVLNGVSAQRCSAGDREPLIVLTSFTFFQCLRLEAHRLSSVKNDR